MVLDSVIQAVGRNDHTLKYKIVGDTLRMDSFSVTWSINRTDYKGVQLASVADFKELVKEVKNTNKVEAKLEITELEHATPVSPSIFTFESSEVSVDHRKWDE